MQHHRIFRGLAAIVAGTTLWGAGLAGTAFATSAPSAATAAQPTRHVSMPDGSTITVSPDGLARRVSARGKLIAETMLAVSAGRSALGDSWAPSDEAVRQRFQQLADNTKPTDVIAELSGGTAVTGTPIAGRQAAGMRAAVTSNGAVNAAFAKLHADSVSPLFGATPAGQVRQWASAASSKLGTSGVDLSSVVVVHLHGGDATAAANALKATPGVSYAEPDRGVTTLNVPAKPLPSWTGKSSTAKANDPALPANYGLASSLQSFLNSGGVNAEGAFSELTSKYGQLPGTGETVTNVSVGDLTDASMSSDPYVQAAGPTTIIQNGQRYLDMPSMPLIPTYVADASGNLSGTASAENEDPGLGEVGLDFSVMTPLPHSQQRPGSVGSGVTDLLGVAPGAQYRLVVPSVATFDQIAVALMAAARQNPRPDVITASLGFGTDGAGFPGRYLEDDPIQQAIVAAIVQEYHIVVCIAANDGTRVFTPTAIGPDGGSTPTNVTKDANAATTFNDLQNSTAPSQDLDSGAIDVGASTLDDTLSVPAGNGGPQAHNGTFATVRTNGVGQFSSGMGSRVNVSAPGDGIPAITHHFGGDAQSVDVGLSGGTSASSPETAAAAAVVLQAARLTGQSYTPEQVRSLLEHTGRHVATPPQIDQPLDVGPQVDLTAAVNAVLNSPAAHPRIVRVSVAHRQTVGLLGADYTENTDPSRIDLTGPAGTGEGLVGPVTIGADVTGLPASARPDYVLQVGGHEFHSATPAIRLTPTELLNAAGLPVIAPADRTVQYTFQVREHGQVVASAQDQLTFSGTDGTYAEALAPVVPATVPAGRPVTVRYDLTGVRGVASPQLVVSTDGRWSPAVAPIFTAATTIPLTRTKGTVTVPASAFDNGGGLYGIGIVQNSTGAQPVYGEFASIRVGGTAAERATAPTLAVAGSDLFGHNLDISRATPDFSVRYDVRNIPGAAGTAVEISPPAPSLFGSLNTVDNMNGTNRDHDGVDTGSVVFQPLPGTSGTARLNVDTLRLTGSVSYDIRVFATDAAGQIIGQASPTSMLTLDDGRTQNGDMVDTFAIVPGGQSVVTLRSQTGQPDTLRLYDQATGTYGAILTTGKTTNDGYSIIGVDPSSHHVLVLHWIFQSSDFSLETYDTSTAKLVASVAEPTGQYTAVGGRVDPTRHRAAVLVHRQSDGADLLLPVDMATGQQGTAVPADAPGVAAGTYGLIDIDRNSGSVLLAKADNDSNCSATGPGFVAGVSLDTGAITPAATADGCADRIAIDQGTGTLYQMSAHADQLQDGFGGPTSLIPSSTSTLKAGNPIPVRQLEGEAMAVDSVHHLALVAFVQPDGTPTPSSFPTDNNATSELAVVDLATGKQVSTIRGFDFLVGFLNFSGFNAPAEQQIELDPATRTGWTYSVDGQQLQQFNY